MTRVLSEWKKRFVRPSRCREALPVAAYPLASEGVNVERFPLPCPGWPARVNAADGLSVMNDVTRILSAIEHGDPKAAEGLLPLVYAELRALASQRLAQERPGQTLQATALVHEAYLRLVQVDGAGQWNSRGHFFAAAAEAMRRILVNQARDKKRMKRGGSRERVELADVAMDPESDPLDILALDGALDALALEEPVCAELVKLRFFAGLTQEESAQVLGVTRRTADRYWAFARAWLLQSLGGADDQTVE